MYQHLRYLSIYTTNALSHPSSRCSTPRPVSSSAARGKRCPNASIAVSLEDRWVTKRTTWWISLLRELRSFSSDTIREFVVFDRAFQRSLDDIQELYGGFVAKEHAGFNVVPGAFSGRFPIQVRFRTFPTNRSYLTEPEYGPILANNYFSHKKFSHFLSKQQVVVSNDQSAKCHRRSIDS